MYQEYKELLKLNRKKMTQLKNGPRILTDTAPKKIIVIIVQSLS